MRARTAAGGDAEGASTAAGTPAGLLPSDVAVAAALSRRPFGLRSARAVGVAAGRSPGVAIRSLRRLEAAGIVRRRQDHVAEGAARSVAVWSIDWCSPAWHAVAAHVGQAASAPPAPASAADRRLPVRLAHLFWNVELGAVDLERHGAYVASRILRSDDCQALGWLARHLGPEHLRVASRGRGLDPRRARLARLLAGGTPTATVAPAS